MWSKGHSRPLNDYYFVVYFTLDSNNQTISGAGISFDAGSLSGWSLYLETGLASEKEGAMPTGNSRSRPFLPALCDEPVIGNDSASAASRAALRRLVERTLVSAAFDFDSDFYSDSARLTLGRSRFLNRGGIRRPPTA